MTRYAALLIAWGLVSGCQQFAQAAESPDSQVMNFLGVAINEQYPESERVSTEHISINAGKGEVVSNYLATDKFQPCEVGRWICIWSYQIKFMIPKEWTEKMESWEFRGVKFRIVDSYFDSEEVSEILVEAKEEGAKERPLYYLYSFKRGLVSFRIFFWSRGGVSIPVVMSRLW